MMHRRYFIAFTGIDGSGKTTQVKSLVESLKHKCSKTSYIRSKWEPFFLKPLIKGWKKKNPDNTGNINSSTPDNKDRKQKLLNNQIIRHLWLLAFFVDYGLQLFVKIRIKLLGKVLLISDRVFYDSFIDQAVNLGNRRDWLLDKLDSYWIRILFPRPNMVIYIDCPEDIAFSRKKDEYIPNIEYLIDRRKLYLELADKYKWIKIDGSLTVDEIADQIRNTVFKELGIC